MHPWISLGSVQIPTFFLVNCFVATLVLVWASHRANRWTFSVRMIVDLTMLLMFFGLIGARLAHVLYENPGYYWNHPIRIFYLWQGGFVFYGGFLVAFLAGSVYVRRKDPVLYTKYLDFYAPLISISYLFGRIGCFLAGCCFGSHCDLPWSIAGKHPTQIYSSLWELAVLLIILVLERRKLPGGVTFSLWLTLHATGRLWIEFFREDFRGPIYVFSISSWLSLVLIGIGIICQIRLKKSNP
jgi:phosphatidylglycerol---prolipoprotein diacylglyceryl transferase